MVSHMRDPLWSASPQAAAFERIEGYGLREDSLLRALLLEHLHQLGRSTQRYHLTFETGQSADCLIELTSSAIVTISYNLTIEAAQAAGLALPPQNPAQRDADVLLTFAINVLARLAAFAGLEGVHLDLEQALIGVVIVFYTERNAREAASRLYTGLGRCSNFLGLRHYDEGNHLWHKRLGNVLALYLRQRMSLSGAITVTTPISLLGRLFQDMVDAMT